MCGSPDSLQVHHIIMRKYYDTRWMPENLILLCVHCHSKWHANEVKACDWLKKHFPKRYKKIKNIVHVTGTWRDSDLKEIEDELDKLLGEQND